MRSTRTGSRARRGFTLLEAMIAIAISGVVAAAATTATMGIYSTLLAKEQQGSADEESRAILDILATGVFQIGGGSLRPWSAVSTNCWRNTGCTEQGGETLKLVDVNEDLPQASITDVNVAMTRADIALVAGTCPMDAWPAVTSVVLTPAVASGGGWFAGRCRRIAPCSCELSAFTLGAARAPLPAAPTPTEFPAPDNVAGRTFPDNHFDTGTISPAEVITYTYVAADHLLVESRDFTRTGVYESRLVSDAVWGFRVQLGFDVDENGFLDQMEPDAANRRAWVGVFDPRAADLQPVATRHAATALRTLRVGVITGARAPARNTPSTATLFAESAGTTTTANEARGVLLRSGSSVVTMRSLLVFN